jgi:hypothetical protein
MPQYVSGRALTSWVGTPHFLMLPFERWYPELANDNAAADNAVAA